jgi:hypothetical protein
MNNNQLEELFGIKQKDKPISSVSDFEGILQTDDYEHFTITDDFGTELHRFTGISIANKCLPGDIIRWNGYQCNLELRNGYPPIVGIFRDGFLIPYNKKYPNFSLTLNNSFDNTILLIHFNDWDDTPLPTGILKQLFGRVGDSSAEYKASMWKSSPYNDLHKTIECIDDANSYTPSEYITGFTFSHNKHIIFTFNKLNAELWEIYISVTDVATHINKDGIVDNMISLIGQSLYDKNHNIVCHMLPEIYRTKSYEYGLSLRCVWDGTILKDMKWIHTHCTVTDVYTFEEFETFEYATIFNDITKSDTYTTSYDAYLIHYQEQATILFKTLQVGILKSHDGIYHMLENSDDLIYQGYVPLCNPMNHYVDIVNQRIMLMIIHLSPMNYIIPQSCYDINMKERLVREFEVIEPVVMGPSKKFISRS